MKKIIGLLLMLTLLISEAVTAQQFLPAKLNLQTPQKKLIATGWEFSGLRIADFNQIVDGMKPTPFDGVEVGFRVTSPDQKVLCTISSVFNNNKWDKKWFAKDLEILKNAKPGKLKYNFFNVFLHSSTKDASGKAIRIPWTDDEHWANAVNNMAVMAWVAKQSGCFAGLIMDSEDYGHTNQFVYQPSDGSYEKASRFARLRGAQMMKAMAKEYPNITLLYYWLLSTNNRIAESDNPSLAIEQEGELWVPFINGMLDTAPSTVKMVDGTENAYRYMGEDFTKSSESTRNVVENLVAAENKAKYSSLVQVGFGIYVDAHINPEGSTWYMPPLNGSRTERLADNINKALKASDEYVWVYGERNSWSHWKPSSGKDTSNIQLWQDKLPGVLQALWIAKSPTVAAKMKMENSKLENVCPNPGFEDSNANGNKWSSTAMPALWSNWQEDFSHGSFTLDTEFGFNSSKSAKATGVFSGCFIQSINVNPGDTYAVECKALPKGNSRCAIVVRWKTADNKWTQEAKDVRIYFSEQSEGWKKAFGAATVPEGASQLAILLLMKQPLPKDECWFDDIGIYKIN